METRKRNGMKWRRYMTKEGVRVTTYEVPEAVISYLSKSMLVEALERAKRVHERKVRNVEIRRLLANGWKPAAVASRMNMSEAMIRRIRSQP